MKNFFKSTTFTTGLAIFAMLFGAGNLIFPLKLGIISGDKTHIGLLGFIISTVLMPLAGLVGMVFFDGDYRAFFYRIGKIPGALLIFFCMLIIGPFFVMPRIISFSYSLMAPFIPAQISIVPFSLLFVLITFILCYRKTFLVDLLGKILSPIKLLSLFIIICIGFYNFSSPIISESSYSKIFFEGIKGGYNTLDLLGMIFFAYIILSVLKRTLDPKISKDHKAIARIVLHGGMIGGFLLTIVYIGMAYLGAFHGHGLQCLGESQMFVETLRRIMGNAGTFFIGFTIMAACLSTLIALTSVVAEYLRTEILNNKVDYKYLLVLVLAIASFMAKYGLDNLLAFYAPIMYISYPVIIVLTFCNIAYKLFDFKPVKIPVLIVFIFMICLTANNYYSNPIVCEKICSEEDSYEICLAE